MDLFASFLALPAAISGVEFSAVRLPGQRLDFIAKSIEGGPVFLLNDNGPSQYVPAIELKHIAVRFQSTCRVNSETGASEGQFAVISCDADTPELHEVFVRCVATLSEQLPLDAKASDLNGAVQVLLDLFRAITRPGSRNITGLWAELFVVLRSNRVAQCLECWHLDADERFDFSWDGGCLEVKATTSRTRQHELALGQLQQPVGGTGYLVSMLLQPLTGGCGIIDLANSIEAVIPDNPRLRQKLWQNIAAALGSDFAARLDRKFDMSFAERNLVLYRMDDIPSPLPPSDPRIVKVRFRVDLTTVEPSVEGSAINVLRTLFR